MRLPCHKSVIYTKRRHRKIHGKGKQNMWSYIGKVSRIENEKIYVIWKNTSFEDEMKIERMEPFKIS